jgi:MoxR-like ATPase
MDENEVMEGDTPYERAVLDPVAHYGAARASQGETGDIGALALSTAAEIRDEMNGAALVRELDRRLKNVPRFAHQDGSFRRHKLGEWVHWKDLWSAIEPSKTRGRGAGAGDGN